jgi:hypothetical protein
VEFVDDSMVHICEQFFTSQPGIIIIGSELSKGVVLNRLKSCCYNRLPKTHFVELTNE